MIVENFQDTMNATEVITHNQRSESAKKMWEKRRAKQDKEGTMSGAPPMKAWIFHTEWLALMATVITCFIFVHHESVHTNERLDKTMADSAKRHDELVTSINRRVDEANKRSDDLHKEFYELLKEMRK